MQTMTSSRIWQWDGKISNPSNHFRQNNNHGCEPTSKTQQHSPCLRVDIASNRFKGILHNLLCRTITPEQPPRSYSAHQSISFGKIGL